MLQDGIHRYRGRAVDQRVAIGGRSSDGRVGNGAGRCRQILHDDRLPKPFSQKLSELSSHDVRGPTGPVRNHKTDRAVRI